MGQQPSKCRIGNSGVQKLLGMRLFAEVEVCGQSVFENMHDEIAHQNPDCCAIPLHALKTFGNHYRYRRRQHKPGAESNEVGKKAPPPRPGSDNDATYNIRQPGDYAQCEADPEIRHTVTSDE